MSARVVDLGPQLRSAQIARIQQRMIQDQATLLGLLQEDELVARARFEGEVAAIAAAIAAVPPPRPPRRRRRRAPDACASEQDLKAARRAAKQKGMLSR
jgi:hypothetical protein